MGLKNSSEKELICVALYCVDQESVWFVIMMYNVYIYMHVAPVCEVRRDKSSRQGSMESH